MKQGFQKIKELWTAENPAHRWSAVALLVAGTVIRIAYVFQPMHYEESLTYIAFVSRPLTVGLSYYSWPNNHLLNTLLSHLSSRLLGSDPWALRIPALLFGILILPAAYLVGRRLYNRHAALLALALAVPSSQLINMSTQARGYTMQAFLFLALVLFADSILRRDRLRAWIGFGASAALGFYAMPTMLYFFPPVLAWLVLSGLKRIEPEKRSRFIRKCAAATLAVVIVVVFLYLPVVMTTGLSSITANDYVSSLSWSSFIEGLPGNIGDTWSGWSVMVPWPLALFILFGFAVAVVRNRRISKYPVNLPLIVMAWCVLLMLAQRVLPFARNWLPLLPLYLACASAGLVHVVKWALARMRERGDGHRDEAEAEGGRERPELRLGVPAACVLVLALCAVLCLLTVNGQTAYQRDELGNYTNNTLRDAEAITLFLKDELREGDVVYSDYDFSAVPLEYYFRKYDIPLKYLVMNVPTVEEYPLDVSREERRYTWNPLGLRPGGREGLERAFFIVAEKEGHELEAARTYALTKDGGFDASKFEDDATTVLDTGFTQLLLINRKQDAGSPGGQK